MTTPPDGDRIPDPVLPTSALIASAEAITTTSTEPVVLHQHTTRPNNTSHKRTRSKDVRTAHAKPSVVLSASASSPVLALEDASARYEQPQVTEGIERSTTPVSSYEAFPSFDSYPSKSRFSLTRSLSLGRATKTPKSSPIQVEPRKSLLFRSWTGLPKPSPAKADAVQVQDALDVAAENDALMGEALSKTRICLWAGPWRRRPSGEFVCPCGEHELTGEEASVLASDEEKLRDRSRVGILRKDQ